MTHSRLTAVIPTQNRPKEFDVMTDLPKTMKAMVLKGHGDLDAYEWHEDWPMPELSQHEVLS